ncbi:MAG: bifunctional 23S rRNA (guanine(2069)-N(7))-methyltransferase RlmK/23S rRNA (guanine(2445)-N(2))-methyltransferase RlmL [bacterium]|nr:bifunctional 23S rRNA (guanine(2069)-N(7))-methyltransferase RlmK/23S rRNA (guanine(2445)-N(2))-methyltransferase RlmL [bacterium]
MSTKLKFFATCPKGIGDILAAELISFGAEGTKESAAGVSFTGTLETAYRACLWSRVASRILLPLSEFPVTSEDDLYQGVRDVPWEEHFSPDSTFAVSASGNAGTVEHTHFASLKVKDAVVDRFRDLLGTRPSIDIKQPDLRLNLHLARDTGTVSLDLSGEALHKRGYRHEKGKAPLKENLAAAILIRVGWPQLAIDGSPLIDPMCGSGTLPIEAALMAGDVAPGILRSSFGFMGWKNHHTGTWTNLQVEARYRMKEGLERLPVILGYDSDRAAIRAALDNTQRAGLEKRIHFERLDLHSLTVPPAVHGRKGLVIVNPPYGERLGEGEDLKALYATIGERLKTQFRQWRAAVFTGNPELGKEMGLRAVKTNNLYNGTIKCRLLHFDVQEERFTRGTLDGSAEPTPDPEAGADAGMFANRLRKNLRTLGKWAEKEDISCYRLYDADVPEFNFAVDLYDDHVHVQEYEAPRSVDPGRAAARLEAALGKIQEVLGVTKDAVHLKVRRRQRGGSQYDKKEEQKQFMRVDEGDLDFLVNLTDYLDTGLFLDHRITRSMIRELAAGKSFLNLFCYTGSATVYAAIGEASSTTSVDMSNTYIDWARRNMRLNSFGGQQHRFFRADVLRWIRKEKGRYDLIFLDPPTYSRSKTMNTDFDVQRDHVSLIRDTAGLLTTGGTLLFSTNRRGFSLDKDALDDLRIEDITDATIPMDFKRRPGIHKCFKIRTQNLELSTQEKIKS